MPLVAASQIEMKPIDWLWPGHLPRGYFSMLDGDPGLGKSWLALDLCARLSKGRPFPNGAPSPGPANSIVLSSEDGAADVLKARLIRLDADLSRIYLWERQEGEDLPRFPSDKTWLDDMVQRMSAIFVVIDPIVAFLDPSVLVGSETQVRAALDPLAALADLRKFSGLFQRHLNKQTSLRALYRGNHSIAFNAVCRTCSVVAGDPDAAGRVVLAQHKNNFGPRQPSLVFSVGAGEDAAALTWHGESRRFADELLALSPMRALELARAATFLADYLKAGPRLSNDVKAAAKQHDISDTTLGRARISLGVKCHYLDRFTTQQRTYWGLAGQELPAAAAATDPDEIALENTWRQLRAQAASLTGAPAEGPMAEEAIAN